VPPDESILLLGDLNIDLHNTRKHTQHETAIAAVIANLGIEDLVVHFKPCRRFADYCTWKATQKGKTIKSCCDYIMGTNRRWFKSISYRTPCNFSSDHVMIIGQLFCSKPCEHSQYTKERKQSPYGPINQCHPLDATFDDLVQYAKKENRQKDIRMQQKATWISSRTWKLMHQKARAQRKGSGRHLKVLKR